MEREVHISTDYDVTEWMFCAISHIYNASIDNSYVNNRKQVYNGFKEMFYGLSDMIWMLL